MAEQDVNVSPESGPESDYMPEGDVDLGEQDRDFESEARVQGWVPKEKYRGDERDWVDAETFVNRGREINPILRANNAKLIQQLNDLRSRHNEVVEAVNEFKDYHAQVDQRAYERALAQIEAERRQAVKDQDFDRQFELEDELKEIQKKAPSAAEVKKIPVEKPEDFHPDFQTWLENNKTWFGPDKLKTKLAMGLGEQLREEGNTDLNAGFLRELESRLAEEFPKQFGRQFGNPTRNGPPLTPGSGHGRDSGSSRGKRTAADLPADARVIMNKFVKQGLLTPEQYIKDYFGDE
ncbi:MAG: hypothetical protein MN733_26245 [Nitrososphaera sp.]|nr:hypothetical protein [Nitrososphaera sp.]